MSSKKLIRTLSIVLMITDIVATIVAWQLSFFIRFSIMGNTQTGLFGNFLYHSFFLAALVIVFSTGNHLYVSSQYFSWHREFLLVVKSQLQAVATFVLLLYFIRPERLSRLTIVLYVGVGFIVALMMRGMIRSILRNARKKGRSLRHVLVVGQGKALEEYVDMQAQHPEKGLRFIGWVGGGECSARHGIPQKGIDEIAHEGPNAPDAVLIGYDAKNHLELDSTLNVFNKTSIQTLVIPDIENAFIGYTIEDFHGLPMISINAARLSVMQAFCKRLVDFVGALIGLLALSPLFGILAILVRKSSEGPIFFGQERMTQDGETFIMWKFRSMYVNEEEKNVKWTVEKDSRCTPVGQFLRKTSLDEFPQLWNVLKGEMSLIGPRPERPVLIENFKHDIPSYMLRHRMKSGMTGWAQVNGWRGNTSLEKRIECDLYYIRNWSLMLDIKILFLTVLRGFVNENAY